MPRTVYRWARRTDNLSLVLLDAYLTGAGGYSADAVIAKRIGVPEASGRPETVRERARRAA